MRIKKNKIYPFLIGLLLILPLGSVNVLGWTITHLETECEIFNCHTDLYISANIPEQYVGRNFTIGQIKNHIHDFSDKIGDSHIRLHKGGIKILGVAVLDEHRVRFYGRINGSTQNKWGAKILGNTDFENSTWWNSTLQKRVNITTNFTENDYQYYLVTTNTTIINNIQPDGADIRIVNGTDILMPYFIENLNTTELRLWFRGDNQSSENYTMYYYNTSPVNPRSSGTDTFYLFESYENGQDFIWDFTESQSCAGASVNESNTNDNPPQGLYSWEWADTNGCQPSWTLSNLDYTDVIVEGWWWQDIGNYFSFPIVIEDNNGDDIRIMYRDEMESEMYVGKDYDPNIMPVLDEDWVKYRIIINGTGHGYMFNHTDMSYWQDQVVNDVDILNSIKHRDFDNHLRFDYFKLRNYKSGLNYNLKEEQETAYIFGVEETHTTTTTTTTITTTTAYPGEFTDPRYKYLNNVDYEMFTYGFIVFLFAVIFFIWI